jgi:hypothetical protein
MAERATAKGQQQGLEQAASVIFALVGIVPLLVFVFTLWQLGVIHRTLAQASLILTLVLMLLGFWLFRSMLAQMSKVVGDVVHVATQTARARGSEPAAPSMAAHRASASPTAPRAAPTPVRQVAGLGSIWELGELARTMGLLWQREARAHVGRRVQITVMNSHDLAGRLIEATEDGLLLEQPGGGRLAITYRRVQGIEPLSGG